MKKMLELPGSKPLPKNPSVRQPTEREDVPALPFPVVALGASSGGLEAFLEFLGAMPPDSGMAFVLILHLPEQFDVTHSRIISQRTKMRVLPLDDGLRIKPDHVYVIRPHRAVAIRDGRLHLMESIPQNTRYRLMDDFFRSLARTQKEKSICVILSGPGSGGTAGAQAVKAAGGLCIAQNPQSAKFSAMPQCFVDSGLVDFVLPPAAMPEVIVRFSKHPYLTGGKFTEVDDEPERQAFIDILAVLRSHVLHDFSGYKKAPLVRRIQRRMGLAQLTHMADYTRRLRQSTAEAQALADDMHIHATGFFRDAEAWKTLRQQVIEPLVAGRNSGSSIRAWVTACSTGEEAYSLAIVLWEAAEAAGKNFDIRIFATDASELSLNRARAGLYPGGIESEVSPARLHRFFEPVETSYRVNQDLRELVVFAAQDVLQDTAFSNLDLCTCRDLLSYLEPEGQQRVLLHLHFGLRGGGTLLLDKNEIIPSDDPRFELIDLPHRIFRKMNPTGQGGSEPPFSRRPVSPEPIGTKPDAVQRTGIIQLAKTALLDEFGPPAVVIDRLQHIIYFHGNTGRYLEQPRGEPTRSLMSLLREPLRSSVRQVLQKTIRQNTPTTFFSHVGESAESRQPVKISIVALNPQSDSPYFLISFDERPESASGVRTGNAHESAALEPKLADELQQTRDDLQNTIEQLRTNNSEIRAHHVETISMNEVLQSSNENLKTSKEELQAVNEEMTTVNAQLHAKMEELEGSTNDMSSLLRSTNIAVVFLDPKLRIRRYTPAVSDLFRLNPSDIGRPLRDIATRFTDPALLDDTQTVLGNQVPIETEVVSDIGRTYIRQTLPYLTIDHRLNGIVLTFVDITQRKHAEMALRANEAQYRLILQGIKEYAIFLLDRDGRFASWATGAERILGYSESEVLGQHIHIVLTAEDRAAGLAEKELNEAEKNNTVFVERWHVRKDGSKFWGTGTLSALYDESGRPYGFVKVIRDNTDRKFFEEALKQSKMYAENANASKNYFLANVSHELRTPLATIMLWAKLLGAQEKPDPAFLKEGLDAIEKSSKEQQALIEDLMDTSKIVAGKLRLEFKEMDLNQLIHDAMTAVRPIATEKGLSQDEILDPEVGIVRADPRRLRQVLMNVLNNAVKFTPAGGHISVKSERIGAIVEIHVADTGQGISKEFISRVFERYMQVEQSTVPTSGGMGLGLAIARQLVESHSGTIRAHSDGLGKGTVFSIHVHLPRIIPRAPASVSIPKSAPTLTGLRILLVEDAPATRKALSTVLTKAGAEVIAVDAAAPALVAFDQQPPDLILSDIGLGKVSGHELIKQIRAREKDRKIPSVPAVALTAYADEKNRQKALECGFQECLTKPVEPVFLLSTLAAYRTDR